MLYNIETLATIISYAISAVFFFVTGFQKEWWAGKAVNGEKVIEYSYGLNSLCLKKNNTIICTYYDDIKGVYNEAFTSMGIFYYAMLIGGSFAAASSLLMLVQTESRKRAVKYKIWLGLRYLCNGMMGFALGGGIWMAYQLIKITTNDYYDPDNGVKFEVNRSTGYAMGWVTVVVAFIACVIGSVDIYCYKEHFKCPTNDFRYDDTEIARGEKESLA